MLKANKHIEIVRSTKSWLSSMSQPSCDAIFAVLAKHYSRVGVTIVNDLSGLENLTALKPDLVFLGLEFVPTNQDLGWDDPDKIWLSQYLDEHGIAYTGSGQMAHKLERNKELAKQCALDAGLKTSPYFVIGQDQPVTANDILLSYPVFIKPTNRGGGLGIDSDSIAHNFYELKSKVQSISTDLQSDSLIEEYLPGREFSVAILKIEHSAQYSIMPLELIAPLDKNGARFLSAQIKSSDTEQAIAIIDKNIKSKITQLAMDVFYALGARDYGRIDIRLDSSGTPHFLEANLIPSLISGYGNFPKACMLNMNLGYESMILSIVRLALIRDLRVKVEPEPVVATNNLGLPSLEPVFDSLNVLV